MSNLVKLSINKQSLLLLTSLVSCPIIRWDYEEVASLYNLFKSIDVADNETVQIVITEDEYDTLIMFYRVVRSFNDYKESLFDDVKSSLYNREYLNV